MSGSTMYQHAQSLVAPIKAVSIGGLAHQAVCGDRLRAQAARASAIAKQPHQQLVDRYARVLHAAGLSGAVALRVVVRPLTLPLDLLVGTGRHRYASDMRHGDAMTVAYVKAFVDHPLDTGLLGLVSAYNLAKHAMIAGSVGASLGAAFGLVLWPFRGLRHGMPLGTFVRSWVERGAFFAGCFGALMGSCLIMAPHNFIAVQGLRTLTAVPKAIATATGYALGVSLSLVVLVAYDLSRGTWQRLMAGAHALKVPVDAAAYAPAQSPS